MFFLVVAHRGFSGIAPENTLPAFEEAINTDADFVELDVRKTRDGALVVSHDRDLHRVFGSSLIISDSNLEKLKSVVLRHKKYGDVTIATLEEALDLLSRSNKQIIIEIKESGYEDQVVKLVKSLGLEDRVHFASFNFASLKQINRIDPKFPLIAIANTFSEKILKYVLSINANILALRKDAISPNIVRFCMRRGVMVNAWIINSIKEAMSYLSMGVSIISTDYPDRISDLRRKLQERFRNLLPQDISYTPRHNS